MKHLVLGTAGHIDHGKASLVLSLTGTDPDRLKEEKERGITIELGFARLDLPGGARVGIVDVPGHERFVRTMVAGVTGVDLVALVVAADEGIMPQTREHLDICRVLGVKSGLVVLSKADLVDAEWMAMVRQEVRGFLGGTFLDGAPTVEFSARDGRGRAEVIDAIARLAREVPDRPAGGSFRLPIDRVFTMKGFGTVVTGTSIEGRARVGDELRVLPGGLVVKVRGLQVHGETAQEVEAGNRTAINLQGVGTDAVRRGDVLVQSPTLRPTYLIDARLHYLASAPSPLKARRRVRFHVGTSEILARAIPLDAAELAPGADGYVQLRLEEPAVCQAGDRFVLRSYSPMATLGGGTVVNALAEKHRSPDPAAVELLGQLDATDPATRADALVRAAGQAGIAYADLAAFLRLPEKKTREVFEGLLSRRRAVRFDKAADRVVSAEEFERLAAEALALVAAYHEANPRREGMPKAELEEKAARGRPPELVARGIEALVAREKIAVERDLVRQSAHRVVLPEREKDAEARIVAEIAAAGLTPPTVRELSEKHGAKGLDVPSILRRLAAEGKLVALDPTLHFAAEVLADLQAKLLAFFETKERLDAQAFKALTGLSRKFAIPILEYLDRAKFTVRVGDARVLRKRPGKGEQHG